LIQKRLDAKWYEVNTETSNDRVMCPQPAPTSDEDHLRYLLRIARAAEALASEETPVDGELGICGYCGTTVRHEYIGDGSPGTEIHEEPSRGRSCALLQLRAALKGK
jgi:hypothetical protein